MILTMNEEYYVQKHGTAMGTKMAPAYANLFMGKLEEQALNGARIKPIVIFLEFHSTKQGLLLVDSWSRGLD